MGFSFSWPLTSILKQISEEINKILKNNKLISKENDIIKCVSSFLMSGNFNDLAVLSYYFLEEKKNENKNKNNENRIEKNFNEYCFLIFIVEVIEMNEKFLSLKILFPLVEELINNKFENQLQKIKSVNLKEIMEEIIQKFSQNTDKIIEAMNSEIIQKLVEKNKNYNIVLIFFILLYFI